jgi:hypothetical protein
MNEKEFIMNRIQKNKQLMGYSVSETLKNFQATWQGHGVFEASVQRHSDNMQAIAACMKKQANIMALTGLVSDKNMLRELITASITRIISGIRAFAGASNDFVMASSVNFKGRIHVMSDIEFLTSCRTVLDVADKNVQGISAFGITSAVINETELDVQAFDSIIKKPQALRAQGRVDTTNLKKAMRVMKTELINQMDNIVRAMFPETDFAKAYFNSRVTYNYNGHRTILRGTVTNASGMHVSGGIVELIDYPNPGTRIKRKTNADGNYAFKQIDFSRATLRIHAKGYVTSEYIVEIERLKVNRFDVQLLAAVTLVESG